MRAQEIFDSIAGANAPAGKFIDIKTKAFYVDFRLRLPEITGDMGWVTRIFLQRGAHMVDTRRLVAADFDQDRAKCPDWSLVEKIVWLFHFDKAAGHTQEIGPEWMTEMSISHGPIAAQLGIKPVLTDEQWTALCKLLL